MAIVLLIWIAACGGIGYAVGKNKGRGNQGLLLGLVLGLIGVAIVACLKPRAGVAGVGYPGFSPYMAPQASPSQAWPYAPQPTAFPQPQLDAQWLADPSSRNQLRWWDGQAWTEHVSNSGQTSVDPIAG